MNDEQLQDSIRELYACIALLEMLMKGQRPDALLTTFAKIEDAARKAGWRIQELKK
jgi:hypothetical protein